MRAFLGEVSLHRLTWQRVWSLAAPKDKTLVTALAWRPDGKQLAVAYDSCKCTVGTRSTQTSLHG